MEENEHGKLLFDGMREFLLSFPTSVLKGFVVIE